MQTASDAVWQMCFGYRGRILNSGDKPSKKLPARLVFDTNDTDFKFIAVTHDTNPEFEFGEIKELSIERNSRRFEYELLNPELEESTPTTGTNSLG